MNDVIAMRGGLGLNKKGIDGLGGWALVHYDQHGALDIHAFIKLAADVRELNPTWRDDYPHPDDPQLAWLDSIDAIAEAPAEKVRRYMQPTAVDSGLHQRFNERVTWLRNNKVRRPKTEPVQSAAATPLTPERQAQADARKRLDAVYAKIDKAGGPDWQQKTLQFRAWLRNKVAELIRERRGIGFIEQHIDKEIRDQELGSIR